MTAQLPAFPPLMKGLAAGPANPFPIACDQAKRGTDAGLITWSLSDERLRAALVLAPETPLEEAMSGYIASAVGFQNALGALAPPETAVQLEWSGGVRLNGAHTGGFHIAAANRKPNETPDWLVVGLDITLSLPPDWEPGDFPDRTAFDQEGCAEVEPINLLEAWSRHTLLWLNALEEPQGRADLHREWLGLAWQMNETVTVGIKGERLKGTFLGVDENFGMLLKTEETTRLIPLSTLLEDI